MSRSRPHRTERARDGYQVPIPAPVRQLNTGTLESWYLRELTSAEIDLKHEVMDLGANLVAVNDGYAITDLVGRNVLAVCATIRAVRTWMHGYRISKAREDSRRREARE